MPLIMKFTLSSRAPAELNENEPWPRRGAVSEPLAGGVTVPGVSRERSTKWRPLRGISCTVVWLTTAPTEDAEVSMSGALDSISTTVDVADTLRLKFASTVVLTEGARCVAALVAIPFALTSTRYVPTGRDGTA